MTSGFLLSIAHRHQRKTNSPAKILKNWAKLLQSTADTVQDILILGDLNFHLEDKGNLNTQRLQSYMDEFGLTQLINEPTHNKKHTLDVLIARDESHIIRVTYFITYQSTCKADVYQCSQHLMFKHSFSVVCGSLYTSLVPNESLARG